MMQRSSYIVFSLHFFLVASYIWFKLPPTTSISFRNCQKRITVQWWMHAPTIISSSLIDNSNNQQYIIINSTQWSPLLTKADIKFLTALHIYQSLYHTTHVPYLFVVPESSSDWPDSLWSYSLGVKVNHVRYQGKTKSVLVSALESIGFEWSAQSASNRRLMDALEIFQRRFGHTKVLTQYQIPHQSLYSLVFGKESVLPSNDDPASIQFEWPRELQSLRLGTKWRRYLSSDSDSMSSSEMNTFMVDRGIALWSSARNSVNRSSTKLVPVELKSSNDEDHVINGLRPDGYPLAERIAVAVEYFRYHFGKMAIPEDFYIDDAGIPSSCTYETELLTHAVPWPESLRDLSIGKWLRNPHSLSNIPLTKNLLNVSLSKVVPTSSYEKFILDLNALAYFKSLHGHLNVPSFFVIPKNESSTDWPTQMHGLKLGYNVRQIRKGFRHTAPAQTARLREIGLDFSRSSRQQNFDITLRALDTHNRLFGDLLVPRYFVVPTGDDSWPRDTWGLKLGSRVNSIRAGTSCNSVKQRAQLKEIGFIVY